MPRQLHYIVTNAMLEFLSAGFIDPSALLPLYLFLNMSQNIRITKMLELSKYLNEQLGVFLNIKQQKRSQQKTKKTQNFKRKLSKTYVI